MGKHGSNTAMADVDTQIVPRQDFLITNYSLYTLQTMHYTIKATCPQFNGVRQQTKDQRKKMK